MSTLSSVIGRVGSPVDVILQSAYGLHHIIAADNTSPSSKPGSGSANITMCIRDVNFFPVDLYRPSMAMPVSAHHNESPALGAQSTPGGYFGLSVGDGNLASRREVHFQIHADVNKDGTYLNAWIAPRSRRFPSLERGEQHFARREFQHVSHQARNARHTYIDKLDLKTFDLEC
ncbi:hypothetical protein BGW80DRAFT_141974 [Lactifluus volemus]|nr:hypothetical protein BGW80DRAFT_141974 [Lactifluus volemus]